MNYVQPYPPMSSSKHMTMPPMINPRVHDHQSITSHASNHVKIMSDKKLMSITTQPVNNIFDLSFIENIVFLESSTIIYDFHE